MALGQQPFAADLWVPWGCLSRWSCGRLQLFPQLARPGPQPQRGAWPSSWLALTAPGQLGPSLFTGAGASPARGWQGGAQ